MSFFTNKRNLIAFGVLFTGAILGFVLMSGDTNDTDATEAQSTVAGTEVVGEVNTTNVVNQTGGIKNTAAATNATTTPVENNTGDNGSSVE